METYHPPQEVEKSVDNSEQPEQEVILEKWLNEKIDSLIPLIKEKWPNLAKQTLIATKGSIDELVEVIANNTGTSAIRIKRQLIEIINSIQENKFELSEKIEPIESQLEELLEELNNTLRPKIESPIRKKPLLSIAIAAGIGLLIGTLLNSGRK